MVTKLRFWFLLQQDVDRPIGGVKQIYTVASIISELGYSVTIVQGTSNFRPSWFSTTRSNFLTIGNNDFSPQSLDSSTDVVVIPETFLPLLPKLQHLRVVIFNQNMHYLFGEKLDFDPSFVFKAYASPNIVAVLTVSSSDHSFAIDALPIPSTKIHRIFNAIEDDLFSFSASSSKTIAYMPRKNQDHAMVLLNLLKAQPWFNDSGWSFSQIHNKSLSDVSSILRNSSIFLSFGYPEGFGLPLAEAIVSGCYVVGYDGIGGSEISEICRPYGVFSSIPYRDFHSFLICIKKAMFEFHSSPQLPARLQAASLLVSSRYSSSAMRQSIMSFLSHIIH